MNKVLILVLSPGVRFDVVGLALLECFTLQLHMIPFCSVSTKGRNSDSVGQDLHLKH